MNKEVLIAKLCHVSESVIRRQPPFDKINANDNVFHVSTVYYYKCNDKLSASMKKDLLDYFVCRGNYNINCCFNIYSYVIDKKISNSYDQFMQWLDCNFRDEILKAGGRNRSAKAKVINETAIHYFPKLLNGFSHHKTKSKENVTFIKVIDERNSVKIIFDKGTISRSFFSLIIEWENPYFMFDIASFFSNSQSKFKFYEENDLIESIKDASGIVNILIPVLEQELRE